MKLLIATFAALLLAKQAFAESVCDETTILRLVARASCNHSNNAYNCKSMALFSGTAASAAVLASLGSHEGDPQAKLVAEYLRESQRVRETLLKDYKKVLEVYYELKKKSANPNTFVDPMVALNSAEPKPNSRVGEIGELHFGEYKEFKAQMDSDPRLKNNEFLRRFNEYGSGAANDIFQRVTGYTNEKFPILTKEQKMVFLMEIGMPNDGLALIESRMAFTEMSAQKGYPQNKSMVDLAGRERNSSKVSNAEKKFAAREGLFAKLGAAPAGSAAPKVAPEAVMGAVGLGFNIGTPMISEAAKHESLNQCAKSLGARLNESDVITLGKLVEVDGLAGNKKNCDAVMFTADGASQLVNQMGKLSPDAKQFLCKMEGNLALKQDTAMMKASLQKAADAKSCAEKIELPTSAGVVHVSKDSDDQWIYSSTKADDPGFNAYLDGKVRMASVMTSQQRQKTIVNPAAYCDGRELTGKNEKAMCELTRGMNAHSQLAATEKIFCSGAFNAKSPGTASKALSGSR